MRYVVRLVEPDHEHGETGDAGKGDVDPVEDVDEFRRGVAGGNGVVDGSDDDGCEG